MFIDTIAFLTISTIIHNSKLFCHVYMYALRNNLDKYFKNNLQYVCRYIKQREYTKNIQ